MRYGMLCMLFILVSGCGTATTVVISPIPVPDIVGSEQAEINVCRKYISLADAATTITMLDHEPVLRSTAGKCFSARLSPGGHTLTVITKGVHGPRFGDYRFVLYEGQVKYFVTKLDRVEEISQEDFADFNQNYTQVNVQ